MSDSWRSHRARLAAAHRHHPETDPTELRLELRAARAEDYIRDLVDAAPPLTETQRARLAVLLLAPAAGGEAA